MIDDQTSALIRNRMEQSTEAVDDGQLLLEHGRFRASLNRSYYAMFYACLALANLHGESTSKHSGAIALFDRHFVHTRIFGAQMSAWLHAAFDRRQKSDYKDMAVVERPQAEEALDHARQFVEQVKTYLAGQLGEPGKI